MKRHLLVDEHVLAGLLQTSDAQVWQTTYAHYRTPFLRYFVQEHGIGEPHGRELFREAFAFLLQGLREGSLQIPGECTLFSYLVQIAEKALCSQGQIRLNEVVPQKPYLAGEVLVLLIRKGCQAAFLAMIRGYGEPVCQTLRSRYSFIRESPGETLGEALMIVKSNIETERLKLPLRCRLFTYAYRTARNRFLAFANRMQKEPSLESEEEWDRHVERAAEKEKPGELSGYLVELWPPLSRYLAEDGATFEQLTATLNDIDREILRLRYVEGWSHRKIGQRLDKSEGAVRKAVNDIQGKWRALFFREHVLQNAESSLRTYLEYYLIKRWSFGQIADRMGKKEEEIRNAVECYLREWRRRYA